MESLSVTDTEHDNWTKLKSIEALEMLTSTHHADNLADVKRLEWTCDFYHIFKLNDLISVLNLMPNIVDLKLKYCNGTFTSDDSATNALNLPHLKSLELSSGKSILTETFAPILPKNTLNSLKVNFDVPEDVLKNFFNNQQSIKQLDIEADITDISVFEHLKLTDLRYAYTPKKYHEQNPVSILKNFIRTQPDLVSLDCLESNSYTTPTVDDELFLQICDSKKLESLKVNVDGVSPKNIQHLSELLHLKTLWMKANHEESMKAYKQLSLIPNAPIKHLFLIPWGYEIPLETYQRFGENFNLKSLQIYMGTEHSINFFKKTFPSLESLNVRFGESNNRVEFSQVYTEDDEKHLNMKHLKLDFWGGEVINTEMFFKMFKSFPSLEIFEIHTKVPFTSDFFGQLINNLGHVKALKMSKIEVRNNETFPPEIIQNLKVLRGKLNKCHLSLSNVQEVLRRAPIVGKAKDIDYYDSKFTFEPLVEAMKDDFKTCVDGYANTKSYTTMEMASGFE